MPRGALAAHGIGRQALGVVGRPPGGGGALRGLLQLVNLDRFRVVLMVARWGKVGLTLIWMFHYSSPILLRHVLGCYARFNRWF